MQFDAPATSVAGPRPADIAGHLLIISPTEYRTEIDTVNGKADAIACDLIDLSLGSEHENVLFFNIALRGALKPRIGQHVLARIDQGTAKPGKNAPWILVDATQNPADVQAAQAYLAAKTAPAASAVAAPVVHMAAAPVAAVQQFPALAAVQAAGPALKLNADGTLPPEVQLLMDQMNAVRVAPPA
ncbi:hypothetical protein UFOVP1616_25 [uncultured Caudovirales phage]|uniref:Uncharacterized protein n=1 Tax=uncultured Caudovirales phage TaxID=2100421 RepID=A0A6J5SY79_9CAUD|nr:hypothetical protein UFOVP1467_41 [uncultured Caudovirales phage]CAB4219644.1 hypothetical protein UFOVP1616_25 [uncultured Caudovirales phage]